MSIQFTQSIIAKVEFKGNKEQVTSSQGPWIELVHILCSHDPPTNARMPQAHPTPLHRSSPAFFASRIPLPRATMDIDDILASVDRGAGASLESTAIDHQLLTRFWVAERAVSEVLPWPAPLMERMMDRVRLQVRIQINRDQVLHCDGNHHLRITSCLANVQLGY